jgi:purine-binding chemotaxis protein CheW
MQEGQLIESNFETHMEGRYLTFVLQQNNYAVPIIRVQEIIGVCPITKVPKSRPYLRGIMNLRGKVIPVVELRLILGMPEQAYTEKTCFVVVHSNVKGEQLSCGLVVDQVNEVIDLSASELTETNQTSEESERNFLMGFGRSEKTVAMLLDIDSMLAKIVAERRIGFKEK